MICQSYSYILHIRANTLLENIMKNVLLLLITALLFWGCDIISTIDTGEDRNIEFLGVSEAYLVLDAYDSATIYYAFRSTDFLTDDDIEITVLDSEGYDASGYFDITTTYFLEKQTSLVGKESYFRLKVNGTCDDGNYTIKLKATVSGHIGTYSIPVQVGTSQEIVIQSINDVSIEVGKSSVVKTTANVQNALHLQKENFVVSLENSGSSFALPEVSILSYYRGTLTIGVTAESAVTGDYDATVSIVGTEISESFTISVTEVQPVVIDYIDDAWVEEGDYTFTTAYIDNGDGLYANDFTVTAKATNSDILFPSIPVVSIDDYYDGEVSIEIDAESADPGTYIGTLSVEGTQKDFLITVESED